MDDDEPDGPDLAGSDLVDRLARPRARRPSRTGSRGRDDLRQALLEGRPSRLGVTSEFGKGDAEHLGLQVLSASSRVIVAAG
ncbi:hypothetical protein [Dactylosporangium darangshiense]|uniref:hypothetical protein n=1 Tax=Dactylosporangium darangshiense TaxID=579108 RepID=UPI0031F168CF